ncbi:MAG TPA: tRNA (adenosine(37)-N6)-threonylcarbamoyltransferase complex dimerization subunit type 1 TsaB [Candidatus Dormibacteraeota bacterium]|nr:tRNA (adenosine(37)-N6)-threonylcarbamoyltransferase complex dimerization subunit type 1 TsaB [Candidatus Dormibacteraeota bacterium]
MLILTIRTDKPEAELGLFEDKTKLAYSTWPAHRQLAETIHAKIKELLESQGRGLNDLDGLVVFQGPGSFTGLRIGLSVSNALAYGLQVPIVATRGRNWIAQGTGHLKRDKNDHIVLPEYGAPPHITPPKK